MTLSSSRSVLIVEDDEPKLRAISRFFEQNFERWEVTEARSLSSAIAGISGNCFDIAIIDMSLPTYDMNDSTMGGGTPQGFGGEDIIRFISTTAPDTWMIVVTQYDVFQDEEGEGSRSLSEIDESLSAEIGSKFLGVVFYSGQYGDWQISLLDMLKSRFGKDES